MIYVVLFLLFLIVCFCFLLGFSNTREPVIEEKDILLKNIHETCFTENKNVYTKNATNKYIIKPVSATSSGRGVDFESDEWTKEICEIKSKQRCMKQIYHPGPFECRLYKSNDRWDPTICFHVPSDLEPFTFLTEFDFINDIKECFINHFSDIEHLAIDLRTDGTNFLLLEVNGSYGIPLLWTTNTTSIPYDLFRWVLNRCKPSFKIKNYFFRFQKLVSLVLQKLLYTRKLESKLFF